MQKKSWRALQLCLIAMLISSCANSKTVTSDFCQRYQEIILEKGDANITASSGVKKRIAVNEIQYDCQCKNLKADYCKLGN